MQLFGGGDEFVKKSDISTKTIIHAGDINTLTKEGDFFIESSNVNHFPANYRDMWYFLNVKSTIDHGGSGRIKQTVVPDNTDRFNWILVRAGSWQSDGSVNWNDWLILDFSNGKLLHSK